MVEVVVVMFLVHTQHDGSVEDVSVWGEYVCHKGGGWTTFVNELVKILRFELLVIRVESG